MVESKTLTMPRRDRKIQEYEAFITIPDFEDQSKHQLITEIFVLNLLNEGYPLDEYAEDEELESLVPELDVLKAVFSLEHEGFVLLIYHGDELSNDEFNFGKYSDPQLYELVELEVSLTYIGSLVAKKVRNCAKDYLSYLNRKNPDKSNIRKLNTNKNGEPWAELRENTGRSEELVLLGLYHGARRVRAKLDGNKWVICGNEKDLIAAIGRDSLPKRMNKIDLKKRYGLHEAREIVPVRFEVDKWGRVSFEREDEWGDKARPSIDNKTFLQKFTDDWDWRTILFTLLLPHFRFLLFFVENTSRKTARIVIGLTTIIILTYANVLDQAHYSFAQEIALSVIALYLLLPLIIVGINVATTD